MGYNYEKDTNWAYLNKEIKTLNDIPKEYRHCVGVIYRITIDGGSSQEYIGQKKIYVKKKRIIGKRELATFTDKRNVRKYKSKKGEWVYYEKIIKDNGFIEYCGSNETLLKDIKKGLTYTKEIIRFVEKESMLNYWEQKQLFVEGVLEHPDRYYNHNIGGRFFKRNIQIGLNNINSIKK